MKTFIFSMVSLTFGGLTGYFVGSKVSKKKYLKLADKEIESVKKSLEEYYKNSKATVDISDNETQKEETKKQKKSSKRLKPDVPVVDIDDTIEKKLPKVDNEEQAYKKYIKQYKPEQSKSKKEEKPEDEQLTEPLLKPYIISPEEFADGEYDVKTLNFYSDGILADDEYTIIKDINGYVGDEALNSFGIYEQDVVYVRNDKYKIDYEILFDERKYYDIAPKGSTTAYPDDEE